MINIRNIITQPLVSKEVVFDTLGPEMGQIVIEERQIVFYRYGLPIGAFIGALILIIFIFVKQYGVFFNVW
jgi:hypothetical protein